MAPLIEVLVCTLLLLPLNGFYCFKPIKMDMAEMGQRKSIGNKSEYENQCVASITDGMRKCLRTEMGQRHTYGPVSLGETQP